MNNELIVRKSREMGSIITDAFRFIFRNLKPVSYLLALYVFLPFAATFMGVILIQSNMLLNNEVYLVIGIVLVVVFGLIAFLHIGLVSFTILRAGQEMDANHLDLETVSKKFKSMYVRNLIYVLITSFFFSVVSALIGLLFFVIPVLGGIIAFIFLLIFAFYLYPLLIYAYRIYLDTPSKKYFDAFQEGKDQIDSYWGSTIGLYFVSGIVSNFVQYSFVIPFSIITMLLATVYPVNDPDSFFLNPMIITQYTFMAFGLSYLALFSFLCLYLKSYDIEERQYGTNTLQLIDQLGQTKESFFDNEGSY